MKLASNIRVVHISTVHDGSDTRIMRKECASLAKCGYTVTLIAQRPKGETDPAVRMVSLPDASCRLSRMTLSVLRAFLIALREHGHVYHIHDPELIPLGFGLKLMRRVVIYDVHEDVPSDISSKFYLSPLARRALAFVVKLLHSLAIRVFDATIAATPAIARSLSGANVHVVQNFARVEDLPGDPASYADSPPCPVIYVGVSSVERGLIEMLQVADILKARYGRTMLTIVGPVHPASLATKLGLDNATGSVDYRGHLAFTASQRLVQQARVGLILFHAAPNHTESQPNKLFEYMAAGVPIVASDFLHWRAIIEGTGCGVMVAPHDVDATVTAVIRLLEHPESSSAMGAQGRAAAATIYTWEAEARKLLSIYDALV